MGIITIADATGFADLTITNTADGGVQIDFQGDTLLLLDPDGLFDASSVTADWFEF